MFFWIDLEENHPRKSFFFFFLIRITAAYFPLNRINTHLLASLNCSNVGCLPWDTALWFSFLSQSQNHRSKLMEALLVLIYVHILSHLWPFSSWPFHPFTSGQTWWKLPVFHRKWSTANCKIRVWFFFYFPFPFRKKQKTVGEIQHACNCLLRPRILCCPGKLPRYLEGAQLVIDVLLGELVLWSTLAAPRKFHSSIS